MRSSLYGEKSLVGSTASLKSNKTTYAAIVVCQYGLLWCSLFVVGGTSYVLSKGSLATDVVVSGSLLIANVCSWNLSESRIGC